MAGIAVMLFLGFYGLAGIGALTVPGFWAG